MEYTKDLFEKLRPDASRRDVIFAASWEVFR